ncbi:MAG TPA: transporter substrate-binding domain-containing protein [Thermoanaerobaculia bacterium]|nr:transporter substrate-binding domain-containing protein [Thermoanaerobaculia bacterium]
MRRLTASGFLLLAASWLGAQTPAQPKELVVAVYEAPPWCMKKPDGDWHGATVDLWKAIADRAGLSYRLEEAQSDRILDEIRGGRYATSAGPFASTLERERVMEFTHSYTVTGLAIAVRQTSERDRWLSFLEALTTPTALKVYLGIAVLALVAGLVVWRLERRHNPQFPARPLTGIGSGFWWAGVTSSGVGYGDKVPVTMWGRAAALLWMLISLVMITALIGFVTARLAVTELGNVHSIAGLHRVKVGSVAGSASADFLRRQDIPHRLYTSPEKALVALRARDVGAVVFSDVVLRYYVQRDATHALELVPGVVEAQSYAFPLVDGSPLREPLNAALRNVLATGVWRDITDRFLLPEGDR